MFWTEYLGGFLAGVLILLLAYQQWRLYRFRQEAAKREELFRIVAENAADMIALVDVKGHRLYNSPAYSKILGYSAEELKRTSIFEQIHPEDRQKVLEASRQARETGVGKGLQYRIKHRDGTWRVLESTANTIRNEQGEVEKLVIVNRDVTKRKRAEQQLEQNSFEDSLTGLVNRRLFMDRLDHAHIREQRNPEAHYAVLSIAVDLLSGVDDRRAPEIRDHVIREVGRRLSSCLRGSDTLARANEDVPVGDPEAARSASEEFFVLLDGVKEASDALRVARRLTAAVNVRVVGDGYGVAPSANVGIVMSAPAQVPEEMLKDADLAMRRAKGMGGSRCELYDQSLHGRAIKRLQLEADLLAAIERNQFQLFYQPIVTLDTRQVTGFEALVRWQHPERGLISPYEFIEVAESRGLVTAIGKWVFREACRQTRIWQNKYQSPTQLIVSVNLSARQFANEDLLKDIRAALRDTAVEPSALQLEVAESVAIADAETAMDVLSKLKQLGVGISISDFGTGYASLHWLPRWPCDEVKIGRALIASAPTDRCSFDVVHAVFTVARNLELRVIADGIETGVQLTAVKKIGCEFGQGYYFAQPIRAEDGEELLRQQTVRSQVSGIGR